MKGQGEEYMIKQPPIRDVDIPIHNYRIEMVPVFKISIDPSYHHAGRYRQQRADLIGKNWDEAKAGVITVSERPDGRLILIDGNHRRGGAVVAHVPFILAKVFTGLTRQEEAAIFLGLSDYTRLTLLHRWLTRRVAGDSVAIGVENVLAAHGARVAEG